MPLQNRVTPFGELAADPARGLLFGNRGGMFHDAETRALKGRRWASRRWLCCSLTYPGSHQHPVWSRGYTQLFFLDEVTALAAGHRPCAECRRREARAFQHAAGAASLADLDLVLHGERLDGRAQRRHVSEAAALPDGAMIVQGDRAMALRGTQAWVWSQEGYTDIRPRPDGRVETLTPPRTLRALAGGYAPLWHHTANPTR